MLVLALCLVCFSDARDDINEIRGTKPTIRNVIIIVNSYGLLVYASTASLQIIRS